MDIAFAGELYPVLDHLCALETAPLDQTLAVIDARHPGSSLERGRGREGGLEGEHAGEGALARLRYRTHPVSVLGVLAQLAHLVRVVVAAVQLLPHPPAVLRLEDVSGAQRDLGVAPPQLQLVVRHIQTLKLGRRWGERPRGYLEERAEGSLPDTILRLDPYQVSSVWPQSGQGDPPTLPRIGGCQILVTGSSPHCVASHRLPVLCWPLPLDCHGLGGSRGRRQDQVARTGRGGGWGHHGHCAALLTQTSAVRGRDPELRGVSVLYYHYYYQKRVQKMPTYYK